ncbi:MAG: hypothetical protein JST54_12500 [Deltaproteobacteria bacterium]|nr:hypothetical protein [Deltaproteobacteria bacterium]
MRKLLLLIGVAALAAAALGFTRTSENLVLASGPTNIPRTKGSSGFELYNRGPNNIDCALGRNDADGGPPVYPDGGTSVLAGKARPITPGATWSASMPWDTQIWCIATTADQVAGGGTILTEAP